jgi:hypothetical protein
MTRFCFALLGLLYLTNPLTHLVARGGGKTPEAIALTGFITPITMVLLVGVVLGIVEMVGTRAAVAGAALTIAGWTAGCRIIALGQLEALLQTGVTGVPADTLDKMLTAAPIVWLSIVPVGLLFPIGLITLGTTLFLRAPVSRWAGALLIVGGVLFPLGRAVRLEWALSACDVVLGVTFAMLAWRDLRHVRRSGSAVSVPSWHRQSAGPTSSGC